MFEIDFNINGYEKKFTQLFENITDVCIKLSESDIKEDNMLGSEISFELVDTINNLEKVKNKKELIYSYFKAERRVGTVISKLRESWAFRDLNDYNLNNCNGNNFITEEPDYD